MDNLQSMTYQTFEQDPVKYRNYEEVRPALNKINRIVLSPFRQYIVPYRNGHPVAECAFSSVYQHPSVDIVFSVICVAGAGRGPLVVRCLSAIERSRREAFIYVVEKNPNAFVTYVNSTYRVVPKVSLHSSLQTRQEL